ncbi:MAG: ornithine cyclodeaminase family protein, partial [Candidatus Binatia bacterium]|nr:ornithine cyclodeaminase family protein [Candidatus Binatia bacterium]
HVQYSAGKTVMPVRLVVPLPQIKGRLTSMPAYLSEGHALGMKVVTYFENNPKQGLPAILATMALYSPETGKLVCLMDGSTITGVRTACASAVATKALAKTDTPTLGILGAGVQARTHIRALRQVRSITRVKIFSPSGESAQRLIEELAGETDLHLAAVRTAREAVQDVDLLVTASTAKEPILDAAWLKPGVHINAVGSHRPDIREIDAATIMGSKVVVDSREATKNECGDILLAIKEGTIIEDPIHAEIGEVLAGTRPGRESPSEITLYKSVGIAIQDVATARLVYERAIEKKVGTQVEMD